MNRILYIYTIVLALIIFSSCGDSFSTVVDVDLPESDKKMAVHLDLKSGSEDTSYFNVVRVLSEIEDDDDGMLDYDLLDISIQNTSTGENLNVLETDLFGAYEIKAVVNEGITYTPGDEFVITLNYPGLETATSRAVVPENPPAVSNISVRRLDNAGFDDEEVSRLTFTIQDPPEENYYRLRVKLIDRVIGLSSQGDTVSILTTAPVTFNSGFSEDPSVFSTETGILISDKSFNGTTKELTINLESYSTSFEYFGGTEETFVNSGSGAMYFEQISEDRYNFDRSLENAGNSGGGPFSTPITVFSNVDNGFGIFSVSVADLYLLEY